MGLLKRLLGEPGPSQEDLRRQADEEIKQMMSGNSPPSDMPANGMASEAHSSSQQRAAD